VVDDLLFYVTAGSAVARINSAWSVTGGPEVVLAYDDWRWGWTAGLGTEWAVLPNVSIKSEVLYADFGQNVASVFSPLIGFPFRFANSDSVWSARMGVNFKLN
jgi:outer membrane immunogenic protein